MRCWLGFHKWSYLLHIAGGSLPVRYCRRCGDIHVQFVEPRQGFWQRVYDR